MLLSFFFYFTVLLFHLPSSSPPLPRPYPWHGSNQLQMATDVLGGEKMYEI